MILMKLLEAKVKVMDSSRTLDSVRAELAINIWATTRENVSSEIFEQVRFKPACSATEAS